MNTRWYSLNRRLLLLLLGGLTAVWLATVVFSYLDVRYEVIELLDEEKPHDAAHEEHEQHETLARNGGGRLARAVGDEKLRHELIDHLAWRLIAPALLGLPLLGLWVWLALQRGLAPLKAAAAEVASRSPEQLQKITPAAAPREIRPLLDALNQLFARVETALANERRFTADAAHELRTPLAALSTQVQVALRARDDAERRHALTQIAEGMSRAAHLVDQLLTLARLDPAAALLSQKSEAQRMIRIDELAQAVCADHGGQALAKNIALTFDAADTRTLSAPVDADLLRVLLRNLVDNALRYTPHNGQVQVTVKAEKSCVIVCVADSGPGIPAAERARVFERFSRLAGQETPGSGLGLSIVRRIAELHGAEIHLGTAETGGLMVTLTIRRPPLAMNS